MKLKICGMNPENIIAVAQLKPDFMGFIFYGKSPRECKGDVPDIPESIQKVGVFVDANLDEIIDKIRKHKLQIIQLHGNESPEFCSLLKSINIKVIKVFSVGNTFDFERLERYENVCDYFLFDTQGEKPGGNGQTFNWQLLENYISEKPFFLSGGIGLKEIEQIKELHLPIYAIDINSQFETKPGLKDTELLKRIQL